MIRQAADRKQIYELPACTESLLQVTHPLMAVANVYLTHVGTDIWLLFKRPSSIKSPAALKKEGVGAGSRDKPIDRCRQEAGRSAQQQAAEIDAGRARSSKQRRQRRGSSTRGDGEQQENMGRTCTQLHARLGTASARTLRLLR